MFGLCRMMPGGNAASLPWGNVTASELVLLSPLKFAL
jgi:hypothetical protein